MQCLLQYNDVFRSVTSCISICSFQWRLEEERKLTFLIEKQRERERERDANKVITMQREIPTAISFSQAKKKKSTECEKS